MSAVLAVQEPAARYLSAVQPALVRQFESLASAPGGVSRLRELILMLAVQGKLVPQDPTDQTSKEALKQTQGERDRLIETGKVKTSKPTKKVDIDELPFEVPPNWEWALLSDIVRVLNGRAYSKHELLDAGPTPVLRVGNLFTSDHWYYSNLSLDPDKLCNPGDLLFAWSASLGPFIWDGPKAIYHYHIWKLDPIAPRLFNARYFHLFLREKTAELKAAGHGVAMVHLTKEKMEKISVPWPPLAEQARIVARVDELMRLCDALEEKGRLEAEQHARLLSVLLGTLTDSATPEELASNWQRVAEHFDLLLDRPEAVDTLEELVLRLSVRGLLVEQNPNEEPAQVLLKQLAAKGPEPRAARRPARRPNEALASEPPLELPETWTWARFADVADVKPDLVSPHAHQEAWQVAPDCIEKRTGRLLFRRTVREAGVSSSNHRFEPGQILYSKIRPSLSKAVRIDFGGLCSADMYPVSARIDADYLLIFVLSDLFLEQVAVAENRVKMPKLNQESLNGFLVAVPPLLEQRRIVARVTELRLLCTTLRQRLQAQQATQSRLAEALVEQALA